ncbi:MAG: hypothetical protein JWM11_2770, partial [Planctomycetaceae bacterium]|nr:hypothetical protein [Planctomycetaceae bacterium]
ETHLAAVQKQRPTIIVLSTIVALAGLLFLCVAIGRYMDPFDNESFSQASWLTADPSTRAAMARDVIRRLPSGMGAQQVQNLLGQQTSMSEEADVYGNRLRYRETWSYYLGSWSGVGPYGFDDAFLYVHFDSDKKVSLVEITGG